MDDENELLTLRTGDAVRLEATSPKGEVLLGGVEVWRVERIHMNPWALNMNPGILISNGGDKIWVKFNDEDLIFKPLTN